MRSVWGVALAALMGSLGGFAWGQGGPVKVYRVGNDVTAPQLLPITFPTADCPNPISGEVRLAVIVDPSGAPRNPVFTSVRGDDLDILALNVVESDRFKPGEQNGAQVPVAQTITLNLEGCSVAQEDSKGQSDRLKLHSQPEQKLSSEDPYPGTVLYAADQPRPFSKRKPELYSVGGAVSPPRIVLAKSSIELGKGQGNNQKVKYTGTVLLNLIVDSTGLPQDVRVIRPVGLGLDQKALEAARQWRFMPALRNQMQPVPVMITVEINFRLR